MVDVNNLISMIHNSHRTLFILCGLPYVGKSYIAKQVQSKTDIAFVSIDDIFHAQGFDWNSNTLPDVDTWEQIFTESYEQTRKALMIGKSVLYDSTNQTVTSRDKLRKVAESADADTKVIYIQSPVEVIWKRWEENQQSRTRSVVNRELVQQTIDMFEEPTEGEDVVVICN
jgi:predicted kinase